MRFFNHRFGNDRAVLEHVLQIHKVTVVHMLGEIVGVVEVDNPLFVRFDNVFGKQNTFREVFAHLARHIVTLHGVDRRVFIGIFLFDFFVVALNQRQNLIVRRVGGTRQVARKAIADIAFCRFRRILIDDMGFDEFLDFFHGKRAVHFFAVIFNDIRNVVNLALG